MSVQFEWYDSERLFHIQCVERWTWGELYEVLRALSFVADEVAPARMDGILNLRTSRAVPEGPLVTHLRNAILQGRPNQGCIVLVGADRVMRSFVGMFDKIYPGLAGRYLLADDPDEAFTMIHVSRLAQSRSGYDSDETLPSRPFPKAPLRSAT